MTAEQCAPWHAVLLNINYFNYLLNINEDEIWQTCGIYGGEEKYIQCMTLKWVLT